MIRGRVNAELEPTVHITLLGPAGEALDLTAIIDTGFNGDLTLPQHIAHRLGLLPLAPRSITLGDTSQRVARFYSARAIWDGREVAVKALCVDGDPLVGTRLLGGCRLSAHFVPAGGVRIKYLR